MRYRDGRERSQELLRLAVPMMARQAAAFCPLSYTLWYEHASGMNPLLSQILQPRLDGGSPLSDDEVHDLHERYVLSRETQRLEVWQQKVRSALEEAMQMVAAVGSDTGKFSDSLEQTQTRLSGAGNLQGVQLVIRELLAETMRLQEATHAVGERLQMKAQRVAELHSELQRAQAESLYDPLTGLLNRRGFERAVEDLIQQHGSLRGSALLLGDIDHFKRVNDEHGHLLGDKVLHAIGQTLQANIKGRDLAARFGGEELIVLLSNPTPAGAQALAEQIRKAVAAGRIRKSDGTAAVASVTISFGISIASATDNLSTLIERADSALYRAKHAGRNQVAFASENTPF